MVRVKVKKLRGDAIVPKYARVGDAGMDVVAVSKELTDKYVQYGTGLSFEVPEGYVMLIFPRSSVSKKDLSLANSVGILDSGYRGELIFRFKRFGEDDYEIGERVAQIMILPFPQVEFVESKELSETERGEGGFGSTDVTVPVVEKIVDEIVGKIDLVAKDIEEEEDDSDEIEGEIDTEESEEVVPEIEKEYSFEELS